MHLWRSSSWRASSKSPGSWGLNSALVPQTSQTRMWRWGVRSWCLTRAGRGSSCTGIEYLRAGSIADIPPRVPIFTASLRGRRNRSGQRSPGAANLRVPRPDSVKAEVNPRTAPSAAPARPHEGRRASGPKLIRGQISRFRRFSSRLGDANSATGRPRVAPVLHTMPDSCHHALRIHLRIPADFTSAGIIASLIVQYINLLQDKETCRS